MIAVKLIGGLVVVAAAMAAAIAGGGWIAQRSARQAAPLHAKPAHDPPRRPAAAEESAHLAHAAMPGPPAGAPRIRTGLHDALGREITVSCASCHASLEPNPARASAEDLQEFHRGLHFQHGGLSCVACHHPPDYADLRLADGRTVDFVDVQSLCAQCHAPQARDYAHGAHGGMTGYWDLARGPRQRKGCIDCHDPHAPGFPFMVPTFKPYDRFLSPAGKAGDRHE